MTSRIIYCCACQKDIEARLGSGEEAYPHREDLWDLPFWFCDTCSNFVGCHHKTKNRTAPLGCIPMPELRDARRHLHALIDPVYESGIISRTAFYAKMSEAVGWKYHTAQTRSIEEARRAYRAALNIIKELKCQNP